MVEKIEPLKNIPKGTSFENIKTATSESGISAWQDATDKRIGEIEQLTKYILGIAALTILAIVVSVIGLVIDQMRFNNQLYQQKVNNNQTDIQYLQDQVDKLKAKQ